MVISDTSYMIGGFTIALLTAEFGQVWAEHVCRDVTQQLRLSARFNIEKYAKYLRLCKSLTSLDNMVSLENRITRSCTTLREIVRLYNYAVADKGFGQSWDNENLIRLHNTTAVVKSKSKDDHL